MNAPVVPSSDQNTGNFQNSNADAPITGPVTHAYSSDQPYQNQAFSTEQPYQAGPGYQVGPGYQTGPNQQPAAGGQAYPGAVPPRTVTEDPGKVLGIISLVATLSTFLGFNFIGPVVGIITGHFARKYSRGAGYADNEMGKWGFILGIVFLGLAALGALIGISLGAVSGLWGLYAS